MISQKQLKIWALTQSQIEIETIPIKTKQIERTEAHLRNYDAKNFDTDGNYKSIIQIFNNIKSILVRDKVIENKIVNSYFIENLLYNCSSSCFDGNLSECMAKILQFLLDALESGRISGFICANEEDSLLSAKTWNFVDAQQFVLAVSNYYLETG